MGKGRERIVLIVEDDGTLLDLYVNLLQSRCHMRVLPARDIESARTHVASSRPDVAIVDMRLPDGNGIDLVAELRDGDPAALLLLISGWNDTESTVAAMRAGASDVLNKPLRRDDLIRRVTEPPCALADRDSYTLDLASWLHVRRIAASAPSRAEAARRLGIDRGTLVKWLDRPRPIR